MKTWTTKEIAYLKRYAILAETNYVLNISELAKKLERTYESVYSKIYFLQKMGELPKVEKSKAFNMHNLPWTPEEDKRLIAMSNQGSSNKEIAESLDRTTSAVTSRRERLQKKGKLKRQKIDFSEEEVKMIVDNVTFDEYGYVSNYDELTQLLDRNYAQIMSKISRLRKEGRIKQQHDRTKTSVKSKQAMNQFNDARFAQYKKKEDKPVEPREKQTSEIISVESREVSLILTTVNLSDRRIDQYYTKDGQLLAVKKEPTSFADEVSH